MHAISKHIINGIKLCAAFTAASIVSPSTSLAQQLTIAPSGHGIEKHVQKSHGFLVARCLNDPLVIRSGVATTFNSLGDYHVAIQAASLQIQRPLNSAVKNLPLHVIGQIHGSAIYCNNPTVLVPCSGAAIVVVTSPQIGNIPYFAQEVTSYPDAKSCSPPQQPFLLPVPTPNYKPPSTAARVAPRSFFSGAARIVTAPFFIYKRALKCANRHCPPEHHF